LAQSSALNQTVGEPFRSIKAGASGSFERTDKCSLRLDQCVKAGDGSLHLSDNLQVVPEPFDQPAI